MRIERRPFALTLTIGLHAVLLILLMNPLLEGPAAERGTNAVVVFATRAISQPTVEANAALPPTAAVTPMQVAAPAPLPTHRAVADPTPIPNIEHDGRANAASEGADPFSNPGLPASGSAATLPPPDFAASAQALIDGLFASIVVDTHLIACTKLTASFVTTVNGDGRLSEVRFIAGSLGAPLGERLAHALEAKVMFAPSADGSARRTIIGPISLSSPEQSGPGAETGEQGRCKG